MPSLEERMRDLLQDWRSRQPSMHPDANNEYESALRNQLQSCADELAEELKAAGVKIDS